MIDFIIIIFLVYFIIFINNNYTFLVKIFYKILLKYKLYFIIIFYFLININIIYGIDNESYSYLDNTILTNKGLYTLSNEVDWIGNKKLNFSSSGVMFLFKNKNFFISDIYSLYLKGYYSLDEFINLIPFINNYGISFTNFIIENNKFESTSMNDDLKKLFDTLGSSYNVAIIRTKSIILFSQETGVKTFNKNSLPCLYHNFITNELKQNEIPNLTITIYNNKWNWYFKIGEFSLFEKFYYHSNIDTWFFKELVFPSFSNIVIITSSKNLESCIEIRHLELKLDIISNKESLYNIQTKDLFKGFGTLRTIKYLECDSQSESLNFTSCFNFEIISIKDFYFWFINKKLR